MRPRALTSAVMALALLVTLLPLSESRAHTTLAEANPAVDSTISSWPQRLTLTFAEPLQTLSGFEKVNQVTVTNALAQNLNDGPISVKAEMITVPLAANTAEGPVLVTYRVVAQDGHVVEGEYSFTYSHGHSEATPVPSTTPVTSSTTSPHSHSGNLGIYGGSTVAIVATLLFGIWAYRRRKN
jgi:copper resistance protein C